MRSIFRIIYKSQWDEAVSVLADWLWDYSESFAYDGAKYDDALTMAEEFLRQENPHLEIDRGNKS